MRSEGPPQPNRAAGRGRYSKFIDEVITADGEWVEQPIESDRPSTAFTSVLAGIGRKYVEIVTRKGTIYARLRR